MKNQLIITENAKLQRPIQILNGIAYFATHVAIRTGKGTTERIWLIADSSFNEKYSEAPLEGHKPFSDAPFLIELAGVPRPNSTLSVGAYNDHVLVGKPFMDAATAFRLTSAAIDSFVAFNGSFANQADLVDFLACWVFATYATDAFDTVGYIWPNGERGSGKTQCLKAVMALSFMGQTVTSASSFASVRDEASLGATLGYDDCENISKMENDKRQLLLAGNTKDAGFIHKVPGSKEGQWVTKYIDCFAPRAFTSIGLPDDVLASRTILLPLMRTSDTQKTRRKPTNAGDWAVDRSQIRDAIWLNVVTGLLEIRGHKDQVNTSTDLAGRDFDIFSGPLTIAWWLTQMEGMEDLFGRMLNVMEAYHSSKQKNLLPSLEHTVLQALGDKLDDSGSDRIVISTRDIYETQSVLHRWDITDPTLTSADVQKVGMMLGRIGFKKNAAHGRNRSWEITRPEVLQKARSAGVTLESTISEQSESQGYTELEAETSIVEMDAETQTSGWMSEIEAAQKPKFPW